MQFVTFGAVRISVIAFGHVYCNAVTLITDLICALFGPYAAMFVNRIYPGRSLKGSFVSPGKPWNLVFASPGKSWKTVFYCLYEPWVRKLVLSSFHIILMYNFATIRFCCMCKNDKILEFVVHSYFFYSRRVLNRFTGLSHAAREHVLAHTPNTTMLKLNISSSGRSCLVEVHYRMPCFLIALDVYFILTRGFAGRRQIRWQQYSDTWHAMCVSTW